MVLCHLCFTALSQNHRMIKLEWPYKAIDANPLLNAGIQIEGYLSGGCLKFLLNASSVGALTTS